MYQIIYIDIDEEITAVIDKLRKTKTKQVFLSVPGRALILQSIVSLKLLRKEADRLEKGIILVTSDIKEQKLAEKADIETRESLEGLDTEGEMREGVVPQFEDDEEDNPMIQNRDRRQASEEIGSSDFYDIGGPSVQGNAIESLDEIEAVQPSKRVMVEVSRERRTPQSKPLAARTGLSGYSQPSRGKGNASRSKDDIFGSLFDERRKNVPSSPLHKSEKRPSAPKVVSGRIKKAVISVIILALVSCGAAAAYLFVPSAEIKVRLKAKVLEKDLEIAGETSLSSPDEVRSAIPLRTVEAEKSYTFTYPVSGQGSSGQKAKGTVTIYNEFSPAPQPLVATTRLMSPDRKIFRLVKGVTVPGTTQVGGKTQPGAIEVEVVADEAGESFNIEPTTFQIPGFEGSPKYGKFYAKSTAKMMGGGSEAGGSSGALAAMTKNDLALAKEKAESEAKRKIIEDLKGGLGPDEFFSENLSESSITESAGLSKVGDVASEFQYRVGIRTKALVFSQGDVRGLFASSFGLQNGKEGSSGISLDFGAVNGDLGAGKATIRVHGKASLDQPVDFEKMKKEVAGKNVTEIGDLIRARYPQIQEAEVFIFPSGIFERVPQLTSRIEIKNFEN